MKMEVYNHDTNTFETKDYEHSPFYKPADLNPSIRGVENGPQGPMREIGSNRPATIPPMSGGGGVESTGNNSAPFGNRK